MRKLLKAILIIFLLITLFGFYNLTLHPKPAIILSFGGVIASLIIWIIIIFKERPTIIRVVSKFSLFVVSSLIMFHIGVFVSIKSNKICPFNEPRGNRLKNEKQIDLRNIEYRIDSLKDSFDISVLKQILYKEDSFNIQLIKHESEKATKRMLILSGMHGSEPSGYISIPKIMREIINNPSQNDRWNIDIISPLNPVGLLEFSRVNECGCDINRDFKEFKTEQSRIIKNILKKNKYDIVLDLHEGPLEGHSLLTNRIYDEELINKIKAGLIKNNIKVSKVSNTVNMNLFGFLNFSYTRFDFFSRFDETKVLAQYNNDYNIMNITSESDVLIDNMDKRADNHLIVFKEIVDYYKLK